MSNWMRKSLAAFQLGVSPDTLQRRRETNGGFLENGTHYVLGPHRNSPVVWEGDRVRAAMNTRGLQVRKERSAMRVRRTAN